MFLHIYHYAINAIYVLTDHSVVLGYDRICLCFIFNN
jgi:hypothetical protein